MAASRLVSARVAGKRMAPLGKAVESTSALSICSPTSSRTRPVILTRGPQADQSSLTTWQLLRVASAPPPPAMPRPRVLPSQRRRTAEACNFCREVKKKCSGTVPCVHCLRRGIGSQCCIPLRPRGARQGVPAAAPPVTPGPPLRDRDLRPPSSSPPDGEHDGFASGEVGPGEDFCPPSPSESRRSVDVSGNPTGARTPRSSGPAASSSPTVANLHSRMLLNMRGERGE